MVTARTRKGIVRACIALLMLFSSHMLLAHSLFKECDPASPADTTEYVPITKVQPVYPRRAIQSGKQGWVLVGFTVTGDGRTANPHVVKSYPDNSFNAAAIKAARKFRYEPRRKDGVPVATPNVTNLVTFRLMKDDPRKINHAFKEVKGWLSTKDYDRAAAFLDDQIAHQRSADPLSAYLATLRYLKGVTLAMRGDTDGALANFVTVADQCKRMCTLSPALTTPLYVQTGNIYASRAQWQSAKDYYTRALTPYVQGRRANGKTTYPQPDRAVVDAYASYALAAMNLGDWCSAQKGFVSAISQAKEQSIGYPQSWRKGLELTRRQLSAGARGSHSQ